MFVIAESGGGDDNHYDSVDKTAGRKIERNSGSLSILLVAAGEFSRGEFTEWVAAHIEPRAVA
ncbi:MAG: hypothetical protein HY328_05770 [Chloroflexi bacterium]|nr:hypothetical protein [Chloroflexota bacterium]